MLSFYHCDKTPWPKATLVKKVDFILSSSVYFHHWGESGTGTQVRNLEAGTYTKAVESCCLLACYSRLAQPDFLYNPGPSARAGTTHHGMGPPTSIIIMKLPYRHAHTSVWWWYSLNQQPIFQNDYNLCQVATKENLIGQIILAYLEIAMKID